jgi:hypothetical protein
LAPEAKLHLELARSQSNMLVESLRERALVTESQGVCHLSDERIFHLQHFAGCLDPEFQDEGLRAHAEGFVKAPV